MYSILESHSSECKKEKSVNVEISHNKKLFKTFNE